MTRAFFLSLVALAYAAPIPQLITVTSTVSGTSPLILGLNLGHRNDLDKSWLSYFKYVGTNSARSFGLNGLGVGYTTLQGLATAKGGAWGNSLNGTAVTNLATFQAAVAELRKPNGHNPLYQNAYSSPVLWNVIEAGLNTTDNSSAGNALQGNPNDYVYQLGMAGIPMLAVNWLTCSNFAFTSFDSTKAVYWGERWELYKHQYALAVWSYKRGIQMFEFWNEPDLNAACINATSWVEHLVIRPLAIRNAFADMNADVKDGIYNCPSAPPGLACPLKENIFASAYASASWNGTGVYAQQSSQNVNLQFPAYLNVQNASVSNFDSFSFHSYGKTGQQLEQAVSNFAGYLPASTQLYVTEHQAHTNGNWNALASNSDVYFEASMLANQILWISMYGYNGYVFKADWSPSANGGITKSGIMTAENSIAPYAVGDVTLAGEAVAMTSKHLAGAKSLLTCTLNYTTYSGGFGKCLVVKDPLVIHILFTNNAPQNTAAADQTINVTGTDLAVVYNWAGLNVSSSSYAILHELSSAGYMGEISQIVSTSTSSLSRFLPAFGITRLAIPVNAQTMRNLTAIGDAYVGAGTGISSTHGAETSLKVGTSNTSDHSTTFVSIIQFSLSGLTSYAQYANAAILGLTVDTTTTQFMNLTVYGISTALASAFSESTSTWSSLGSMGLGSPVSGVITSIGQNFVAGIGTAVDVAGHITVRPTDAGAVKMVNVTSYINTAGKGGATDIAFMVVRKFRTTGICTNPTIDTTSAYPCTGGNQAGATAPDHLNSGASVAFFSKESAFPPTLQIITDTSVVQGISPPPPPPSPKIE